MLVTPMMNAASPTISPTEGSIVFFDGICGLCNKSVDFILRHDRAGALRVTPLQGETALRLLSPADREQLGSLVVWIDGRTFRRSAGVVRILQRLGPLWRVMGSLLWLVPLPLRDLGYRFIASNRYRLFGKREACRLPTESERVRFLP